MKQKKVTLIKSSKKKIEKSKFLGIFLILLTIISASFIQIISSSYAAMTPVEDLPKILYSRTEDASTGAGVAVPARSEYIQGISIIKRFYAVDEEEKEYDIYCLDRWLVQIKGKTYTKAEQAIQDKGMAYLLSQIYPNNDQFLSDQTDDVKRYISQLLIWYYQDRMEGYSDDEDVCSIPQYANNECKNPDPESGEDDLTSYWSNSLLVSEKKLIQSSPYWTTMNQLLTEAKNYKEDTNYGISVDKESIKFSLVEDDQYMESNYISVHTTGSNFQNYTLTTNNDQVTFYSKSGSVLEKGIAISPETEFKIRIPTSVVRKAGTLSLNVKIAGTFTSKDAYYYLPPDVEESQRALVGVMQLTPLNKEMNLEIDDPMGSVRISKQDVTTSKELPGATLVLRNEAGGEVARWVSTNTPHYIDPIKAGTYTLTEEIAPDGYVLSQETVQFTVEQGQTAEVVMKNTQLGKASIRKTDLVTGEEVEGATLLVQNERGDEIARWTSGKEAHIIDALKDGTYTLTEETAPSGYVKNENTVTFTVQAGKTTPVEMKNEPYGKVQIQKIDMLTQQPLEGATLAIFDTLGSQVQSFETAVNPHTFSLKKGTYTLKETKAPEGYKLNPEAVPIQIEPGKLTEVTMKNIELGKASIKKTDLVTGEEVEGATLVVRDANEEEIARWTSGKEAHIIDALKDGTYTLTEETAPSGYVKNENRVTFTVEAGKTTPVEMKNEPYGTAQILKIDTTTKKPISGSTLAILTGDGRQIETWETTTKPHTVSLPKGTYTLKEIKATKGYQLNLETIPVQIEPGKTIEVTMENKELGKASIRKTDLVTGEEVEGAILIVQDAKGKEIARWTSGKEAHIIDALEDGTYTLTEITAPDGYVKNENQVTFTIEALKTTPVEMKNEPYGTAQILKIDAETRKLIAGAHLKIQDDAGNDIAQFISTEEPYEIALAKGKYTLIEMTSPEGYVGSHDRIEFEVEAGKLVQLEVENVKKIEVPNTYKGENSSLLVYVVGTIILIVGIFILGLSFRQKQNKA